MELIKQNSSVEATQYAQVHFYKFIVVEGDKPAHYREQSIHIRQIMGFLGIPPSQRGAYETYLRFVHP